jgi:hypothetical protein
MNDHEKREELPERDRLMTRPNAEGLPTPLDPAEARKLDPDPKPEPKRGPEAAKNTNDIGYVA